MVTTTFNKMTTNTKLVENILQNMHKLPEENPQQRCDCGECDGFGNVVKESGAQLCKNMVHKRFKLRYANRMNGWAKWPPPSFAELQNNSRFIDTPCFKAVWELFNDAKAKIKNPYCLRVHGPYGRGKTLAGLCLVRQCIQEDVPVHAVEFTRLIELYQKGANGNDEKERQFQHMRDAQVVFLDEAGQTTGYGNERIAVDVWRRILQICDHSKWMYIATNLTPEAWRQTKTISGAVKSRLQVKLFDAEKQRRSLYSGVGQYARLVVEPVNEADLRQIKLF